VKNPPRALLEPLAITEEGLQLVLAVWSRDEIFADVRLRALEARKGEPLKNTRTVSVRDGVAVIPICGPLFRHADMFADISGATTYAAIRRDMQVALDAADVHAILLNVDSPGGEVNGCGELADAIRAACDVKPIHVYAGGTCASAAYWLASAADRIVCAETAMLGSIGVRITVVDDSKADEIKGIRNVEIVSSQSPDKRSTPVDDSLVARLQARADDIAAIFIGAVARGREVSAATVGKSFGRGDVMIGAAAVDAGMADAIGSFEGVLAEMVAMRPATPTWPGARAAARTNMSEAQNPAASMDDEECDGCGKSMSGSEDCYCSACYRSGAKAMGLADDAKPGAYLARVNALVQLEQRALAATSAKTGEEAIGLIVSGADALKQLPAIRLAAEQAAANDIHRELRVTLERALSAQGAQPARLSLGALQNTIPLFVADEGKRGSMVAAIEKMIASAESPDGKAFDPITRESLLDAVCSVDISASDLRTIQSYTKSAPPVAAQPFVEPRRDSVAESQELDATAQMIAEIATKTNAALDRNKQRAETTTK
jgi:ClpP class serine protease